MNARIPMATPEFMELRYNARPDRVEPTPQQQERFVESFMEKLHLAMGEEYLKEALCEGDTFDLYQSFRHGSAFEIGCAVKELANKYYLPVAIKACDEHDFAEKE